MVLGEGEEKQPCFAVHINCSEGLSVNSNDCLQELRTCPDGTHFTPGGISLTKHRHLHYRDTQRSHSTASSDLLSTSKGLQETIYFVLNRSNCG